MYVDLQNAACMPTLIHSFILAGEWYEGETGDLSACAGFEDPRCSSQWYYTSVADHMRYLSLPIGCAAVTQGRFQSAPQFPEPEEVARREPGADKVPREYVLARQRAKRLRQGEPEPEPDKTER